MLRPELLERMVRDRTFKNIPSEADCQGAVLSAFNEVGERFGDSVHPGVLKVVAAAMVKKGKYLDMLERHEEAIAACDKVIQRWLHETQPALFQPVGEAMGHKATLLHKLHRDREAVAVCDTLIGRFGGKPESGLRDIVNKALACKEQCEEELSQLVKEFELKWRIGVRTAMFIVRYITSKFASRIQVSCGEQVGDGKEMFGWLMLGHDPAQERLVVVDGRAIPNAGPKAGTRIRVAIRGPDEVAVMNSLTELFSIGVRVSRCVSLVAPHPPHCSATNGRTITSSLITAVLRGTTGRFKSRCRS